MQYFIIKTVHFSLIHSSDKYWFYVYMSRFKWLYKPELCRLCASFSTFIWGECSEAWSSVRICFTAKSYWFFQQIFPTVLTLYKFFLDVGGFFSSLILLKQLWFGSSVKTIACCRQRDSRKWELYIQNLQKCA